MKLPRLSVYKITKIAPIVCLSLTFAFGIQVAAEDLIPATSEDLRQFDLQLERAQSDSVKSREQNRPTTARPLNRLPERRQKLEAGVSAEAKKLKDESIEQRQEFGKWVRDQKRDNEQRPSVGGGLGAGASGNATPDARNSAPSTAPGNSGGRGRNK